MKKLFFFVLGALCIPAFGCDLSIPNDQFGTLSSAELCTLSGGEYNETEKKCYCGGNRCGENVSCGVDEATKQYVCSLAGNMDYPQYTCTLKGMTLCFDRVVKEQNSDSYTTSGYFVSCDGTSWSSPSPCENGYSCSTYLEHDAYYATKCGECNNDDKDCIRGTKKGNH